MLVLIAVPMVAEAFSLVPCGQATAPNNQPCEFRHLVALIVRLINYLMTVAAVVAIYHVLSAGWTLLISMGNPEKIKQGREAITHAIVGFAAVTLSFFFVNLLINGLFGDPRAVTDPSKERKWWDVACLYNPGAANCPFSPDNPNNR